MTTIEKNRIREAKQYLEDAEFLYTERIGNLQLLTKLYHAMIYSLFALLNIGDIGSLTHANIIESFNADFVDNGIFRRTYVDALYFSHNLTHDCECANPKRPEDSDIDRVYFVARELVTGVEAYLSKNKQTTDD